MDYLMFIDRIAQNMPQPPEVQFMVSGSDRIVQNAVVKDLLCQCRRRGDPLIIVDDTDKENTINCPMIASYGYQIINGMSGEYCLYNPFQITTLKGITKIRQLLGTLGYDEKQKGKLISYLNFIRHMELLENGAQDFELTLEKLGEYCTVMAVEEKIQYFADSGIINEDQQRMLLAKYSECSSAGADLEDMFFILMPYISGQKSMLHLEADQAVVFRTGELGEDETARSMLLQLLQFGLEEKVGKKPTIFIFDKGYGSRKCIFNLLKSLTSKVRIHVFSEDIFTLCDASSLAMILNRFSARVYSKHLVISSAELIEKACGDVDVVRQQKTVTYDRRWKMNTAWDVLLGNNKTESYMQMVPVREPRYRKEMIMSFTPGSGIVEFMGSTTVFSI